jgi:hypothetical protein
MSNELQIILIGALITGTLIIAVISLVMKIGRTEVKTTYKVPSPPLNFRPLVMPEQDQRHYEEFINREMDYFQTLIGRLYRVQPEQLSSYDRATFSLVMQLQQAVESENYEEAARIRDLINNKKP